VFELFRLSMNNKHKYLFFCTLFGIFINAFSQEKVDSTYSTLLEEVSISINSYESNLRKQAQKLTIINSQDAKLSNSQTTAEVLENTGEIYVQKTQTGGGSPVLRGFEANKIVLMMDGIRLNNAITRGGHTQQTITVDNGTLDKTEVLFGSGSTLYGTDALGGSINFYTKDPKIDSDSFKFQSGNFSLKYGSSNFEKNTHADFTYGNEKIAFLSSFTFTDFDNLRIGGRETPNDINWGKQFEYVRPINGGKDSIVSNENPLKLQNTGYWQFNALQKTIWKPTSKLSIKHTFIYTTSSNIPRYDKLANENRYTEWYYGPQKHLINALHFDYTTTSKLFDKARLILSYQNLQEIRFNRRFQNSFSTEQTEKVNSYSTTLNFNKNLKKNRTINYGYEMYYNDVNSQAFEINIVDRSRNITQTRFPNGENIFLTNGLFAMYSHEINDEISFTGGVRYEYIYNHSTFVENPLIVLPFNEITFANQAIVGNLGLSYHPENWKFSFLISKGFRSPNLDDYGKIRDKNRRITLPSENLRPEKTYSFESNVGYSKNKLKIELGTFYTYLLDAITTRNGSINGIDSLLYNGEVNRIQFNTNTNEANIYGFSSKVKYKITNAFYFYNTNTYTYGWDITDNVPLGHIPPFYGKLGINYKLKYFQLELNTQYNLRKVARLYSPGGVDNLEYASINGIPSWQTLNFLLSYEGNKMFINAGVDNILDQHIRTFSSGVSRSGINIWMKIGYQF